MNIREGSSVLKFSDDSTFSASELIYYAACSDEPYGLALVFLPFVLFCLYFVYDFHNK